jgi:Capsular polysaccharide synthesis protein
MAQRSSRRTKRIALVLFLSIIAASTNVFLGVYLDELQFVVNIVSQVRHCIQSKQTFSELRHDAVQQLWPEPPETRALALGNEKKTIWGYWHQGEESLPGFCQLAVESWRVRHPDRNIVILLLSNFHQLCFSQGPPQHLSLAEDSTSE